MDIKHQSLVLDINETRNYTFIKACQGDQKSRYIDCTLTQNGSVLSLTSNYRAIVKASINNEVKAINSCTIDTTSQVIVVELTSIMLDTPGILNCEITVQDGQQIVTSQAFAVQVRQSTVANETEIKKSKEFGALVDALNSIADVESKADKVQGLVDNIDKLESANDIVTRLSNVESKETQLETQHKTDVQGLTDKTNSIVDQANTDRQNFNNSVDEINTTLDTKENVSNKVSEITHPSLDYYPDTKAVWDYVNSKLETPLSDIESLKSGKLDKTDFNTYKTATDKAIADNTKSIKANKTSVDNLSKDFNTYKTAIANIEAYIGITTDVAGLCVDYENKTFTRLAGAVGLSAGPDFDKWKMYGGRKRCNVADDGTILAYYGDANYKEDGSNGQVMVYQPKFYYLVVPLELEKNTVSGIGNHLRKANYYVSATPKAGFKLHPTFYDANGNEVDYILYSAYEGSMYDVSAAEYVNDGTNTDTAIETGDLLCSVSGVKPISGRYKNLTKTNLELLAQNRNSGWHLNTIKAESANQLLMLIELGRFNTQAAIGQGVVSCPNNVPYNCSSYTGSTASLGNATGMATETTYESAGTETVNTTNGKLSVTYRGVENPWGNIWKHTNGINLWGDGHMGGGQVFICDDFSFNDSKHDGNYKPTGFTISNGMGYVSAFGYGDEDYDWLFMPSETTGNSSLPVGDKYWHQPNLNGYRIARLGGSWNNGVEAGGFCWDCYFTPGDRNYSIGGRLLYVPTATA